MVCELESPLTVKALYRLRKLVAQTGYGVSDLLIQSKLPMQCSNSLNRIFLSNYEGDVQL